jgi:hypothetical protein
MLFYKRQRVIKRASIHLETVCVVHQGVSPIECRSILAPGEHDTRSSNEHDHPDSSRCQKQRTLHLFVKDTGGDTLVPTAAA